MTDSNTNKTNTSKEFLEKENLKAEIKRHNDDIALKIEELRQQGEYYRTVGFWRNIILVGIGLVAATATITASIIKAQP